jgi:hypothetical protein
VDVRVVGATHQDLRALIKQQGASAKTCTTGWPRSWSTSRRCAAAGRCGAAGQAFLRRFAQEQRRATLSFSDDAIRPSNGTLARQRARAAQRGQACRHHGRRDPAEDHLAQELLPRLATVAALAVMTANLTGCGSQSAQELVAAAKTKLDKEDSKGAVIQLKGALQQSPQLAEARFLLGKALLAEGKLSEAMVELERRGTSSTPMTQVLPCWRRPVGNAASQEADGPVQQQQFDRPHGARILEGPGGGRPMGRRASWTCVKPTSSRRFNSTPRTPRHASCRHA